MDQIKLSLHEAVEAAISVCRAGHAPFLISAPGMGKTAVAKLISKRLGCEHFHALTMSQYEPYEFGMPVVSPDKKTFTSVLNPDMLPVNPNTLLFLDEVSDNNGPQQNFISRIVWERGAAGWKMPVNSYLLLAGNLVEHRSGANKLHTKLGGRVVFLIIDPEPDQAVREWSEALGDEIEPWIKAVLTKEAGNKSTTPFMDFDPGRALPVNPMPRTWQMFSDVYRQCEREGITGIAQRAALAGTVGPGPAMAMLTLKEQIDELATFEEIFKDPHSARLPSDRMLQYVQAYMIGDRYLDEKTISECLIYLGRMGDEYKTIAITLATSQAKKMAKLRTSYPFMQWLGEPQNSGIRENLVALMKKAQ